jgi:DNA-binding CsgD family transcriptional regulator
MRSEDADLVAQMHHSIGQIPAWVGFLRPLIARLGAISASLVIDSPSLLPNERAHSLPQGVEMPAADKLQRMRYLRVYSGEDFSHACPFRAMRCRLVGAESVWIIVQKDGPDFAASASSLLTMIADNLIVACQRYVLQTKQAMVAAQMQDLAMRLGLAWLIVERQGNTIAIMAQSGDVPEQIATSGRLRLPPGIAQPLLQGLGEGDFPPIAHHHQGLQILAMPMPNQPARAVIYLQQAFKTLSATPKAIADFTGLTPAEARFVHKMAQGMTIAEAGDALALTPETARYYSKQAYAKLGLPNQTALMRMLDNSVLRML